jgi:hypothetical protein
MQMVIIEDLSLEKDMETMAYEYLRTKEKIKKMEEEVEAFKQVLLLAAKANGGELTLGEFVVKTTEKTRENFSLKAAKQVLSEDILKPFISHITFDDLRVKRLAE